MVKWVALYLKTPKAAAQKVRSLKIEPWKGGGAETGEAKRSSDLTREKGEASLDAFGLFATMRAW